MLDDDLLIKGENIKFIFETQEAKENFINSLTRMSNKSQTIKEGNYICGNCVAYPCFRHKSKEDRAGLCYQEIRLCRDECESFIRDKNSGKSPYFKITGICNKDNSNTNYESICKFINLSEK